ncbi:MAG: glycosyltransferase [Muribaculaceae bacterium]|nr:glycosyltransferase [Muribaculaceae bacterium]
MAKPRIFINMHYMELGGAERALVGLLNALDTDRVDVDLFLNQHTGEFMPLIPKKINLLPERRGYNAIERPMLQVLKEGQYGIVRGRLKARKLHKKYHRSLTDIEKTFDSSAFHYVAECVQPYLPSLEDLGEYDLAISFLQPHNIVLNKVRAKKKIAWIHTDYSSVFVNRAMELPVWAGFDYIASISQDCTKSFLSAFPTLESKIIEIENILSTSFIRHQAALQDVSHEMLKPGFNILSVGRYCHAKNYDNVPDITRRLVDKGFNDLRWYIIGFGGDEPLIRQRIAEAGMEEHVILLGKKDNPYPYIKACDVYAQPSRYEGKSVTVREAQVLCKPVIVTSYPTAKSQVRDGVDGIIVPQDNEGCANGIAEAISNVSRLKACAAYLQEHDYGNECEVEKIYKLL